MEPPEDWQSNKTLIQCNRYMLTNGVGADVSFRVGETREQIKAHKYVLISRSCVFYAMFEGPLSSNNAEEIEIPDIDAKTFHDFLVYLYCEEVKIDLENVLFLLNVAKKYCITSLINRCLSKLKSNMDPVNVCLVMESAHVYGNDDLRKKCKEFILRDPTPVFESGDLTSLCSGCLGEIISDDCLALEESEIFTHVHNYALWKCSNARVPSDAEHKKQMLGDCLKFIRFPIMDPGFFNDEVEPLGLLKSEEVIKIMKYFMKKEGDCLHFNTRPRKMIYFAKRFEIIGNNWGYQRGKVDKIKFSCSKDILMHGILMYGSSQSKGEYKTKLELLDSQYETPMIRKDLIIETDGRQKLYRISFDRPQEIKSGKEYTISLTLSGPPSFGGTDGSPELECQGVKFTFKKHLKSTNNTSPEEGQIPAIVFEPIVRE